MFLLALKKLTKIKDSLVAESLMHCLYAYVIFFRGAAAAVVVYDITSYESFTRAKAWVKELQVRADANIVIALAGNKADLLTSGQWRKRCLC